MRLLLLEESSVLHHKVQVFLLYTCRIFSSLERVPPHVCWDFLPSCLIAVEHGCIPKLCPEKAGGYCRAQLFGPSTRRHSVCGKSHRCILSKA
jgi:hypothetical protein